jgi:glycosyltransferase involved in cell wall biosynthesis
MNILYLNANPRIRLSHAAGYATHMTKTLKGFETAGHRVVKLLAGETQGADSAKHTYRSVSTYLPSPAAKLLRDFYELVNDGRLYRKWLAVASNERFDFAYERMDPLHTCGLRLARRLGIPFVIEINDPMRETVTVKLSRLMKPWAVFLEDRLVHHADLVILGSEELKKSYIRRGCPRDKFLVLYPTADLQMFRPNSAGEALKQEFGLKEKVVLGFVAGNLTAGWRRTDLLLEAFQDLVKTHPNVGALVVGDGKAQEASAHPAPSANGAKVTFSGKIPYAEVPRYINAMDICVIPNATSYGSPTKLFEYGAMAKPVVAPRLPPIQEVIEHGVSGLLFEPNDKDDMLKQITSLVANRPLREQLGTNLKEKIQTLYTWEKNTQSVIEAVDRCQQKTGSAPSSNCS